MKRGGKTEGEMVRMEMEMEMEMEMKYTRKAYGKQRIPLEGNMLICEELSSKKGRKKERKEGRKAHSMC